MCVFPVAAHLTACYVVAQWQWQSAPNLLEAAGDTLFALGCGRLFEGNPHQMWTSLSKMIPLPPTTKVFCAHEYTQNNAKFALSVDPDNKALQQRAQLINDLRKEVTSIAMSCAI